MVTKNLIIGQLLVFYLLKHAPQQNPVEDIWLQAKNFLRKYWYLCRSFKIVKFLFEFFTKEHKFDFPKIHQYTCT
jgi:transposase